jgi:hypothetical protein
MAGTAVSIELLAGGGGAVREAAPSAGTGRLDERGGKYTRCSLVLLAPLMNARPRRSLHGAGIIGNSLLKYRQDVLSVLNHVTCHDAQLVYLR